METELRDRIAAIVNKRELAVRNYKRLKHDLQHTFCCALGLSHRGLCISAFCLCSAAVILTQRM
jgi:hypothetical protein